MAASPCEEEAHGAEVAALELACSLLCPSVGGHKPTQGKGNRKDQTHLPCS